MADVMVTARMSPDKKSRGNRMLAQLGTNASRAINGLYDYVIEHGSLPMEKDEERAPLKDRLADASAWFDSLVDASLIDERFSSMTDEEIRRERLMARGLVEQGWRQ